MTREGNDAHHDESGAQQHHAPDWPHRLTVSGTSAPGDTVTLAVTDNLVGHTVLRFQASAELPGNWQVPIGSFQLEGLQAL